MAALYSSSIKGAKVVSDKTKIEPEGDFFIPTKALQTESNRHNKAVGEKNLTPPSKGTDKRNGTPFRPLHRPKVPILIVLDDGYSDHGEKIRLREKSTTIGRSDSHVCIPHDSQLSKQHAEIIRVGDTTDAFWKLRDLGSVNKTFIRCRELVLQSESRFILGSHFFCFRPAGILEARGSDGDKTTTAVRLPNPKELSPSLVCESEGSGIEELLLTKKYFSIGRPNCGNDAEIDDELLADKHAEVKQSPDGSWRLLSLSSQNGIWAEIDELRLSQKCRFRCGEQQFLFVLT